jgi:rhamnosyltransferase
LESPDVLDGRADGVCAVVVVYHPDLSQLKALVSATLAQTSHLVVIDNGSDEQTRTTLLEFAELHATFFVLRPQTNVGLGSAHNLGILFAKERGCKHVLLLDQDSTPSPDMVQRLLVGLDKARHLNGRVAAVGPRLVDSRTQHATPFVRFGFFGVKRLVCSDNGAPLQADFLISSGTLIPLDSVNSVGLLDETLFIDNVDMEWCFRARDLGFPVFGVCDATMQHKVGDQLLRLGRYTVHIHAPVRQYYIARNRILLYRRSYTPWGWIIQDALRMVCKLVIFSTLIPAKRKNLSMMLLGARDGIRGLATRPPPQ